MAQEFALSLATSIGFERDAAGRVWLLADAALVNAARRGDEAAWMDLYHRYVRMVHGVLLSAVPRMDVDDLVQNVFLSAAQSLNSLRDATAFPGWLFAIARNEAIDHLRRVPPAFQPFDDNIIAPGDHEQARTVLDAIRSLPRPFSEMLTLRLVEGMSGLEIAYRTGLTPASVHVNLHCGMKLLRARLEWKAGYER